MHIATERPFKSVSTSEKRRLFVSGALSTIGWAGAAVSAVFMGFGNIEGILRQFF
jgi:hypothetical protein